LGKIKILQTQNILSPTAIIVIKNLTVQNIVPSPPFSYDTIQS